jgi:hypothetical protein
MIRLHSSSVSRKLRLGVSVALLLAAAPALADPPAAISDPGDERTRASFQRFAQSWMSKVHHLESEQRKKPTIRPGAKDPLVTYRGYGEDFTTELRPTGHATAPFVGILRYTEHIYSCTELSAENCTVVSSIPVTEIFRFQDGRWVY